MKSEHWARTSAHGMISLRKERISGFHGSGKNGHLLNVVSFHPDKALARMGKNAGNCFRWVGKGYKPSQRLENSRLSQQKYLVIRSLGYISLADFLEIFMNFKTRASPQTKLSANLGRPLKMKNIQASTYTALPQCISSMWNVALVT